MIIRFDGSYRTMHFGNIEWQLSLSLWNEWRNFCCMLWEGHAADASFYQGGVAYQTRRK